MERARAEVEQRVRCRVRERVAEPVEQRLAGGRDAIGRHGQHCGRRRRGTAVGRRAHDEPDGKPALLHREHGGVRPERLALAALGPGIPTLAPQRLGDGALVPERRDGGRRAVHEERAVGRVAERIEPEGRALELPRERRIHRGRAGVADEGRQHVVAHERGEDEHQPARGRQRVPCARGPQRRHHRHHERGAGEPRRDQRGQLHGRSVGHAVDPRDQLVRLEEVAPREDECERRRGSNPGASGRGR